MYGRWVVIFVPASSLISPHLLRAAALTPRRSTPRHAAPHHTAPRHAAPRRRAEESWRAGWCAVVLVRMHISVPHILIQGVITRLSSAHSHHCLNHPPPPSSSSRQPRPLAAPSPCPRPSSPPSSPSATIVLLWLSFTQLPRLPCTNLYYPPTRRIFLQTGPSISLSSSPVLLTQATRKSRISFPFYPSPSSFPITFRV